MARHEKNFHQVSDMDQATTSLSVSLLLCLGQDMSVTTSCIWLLVPPSANPEKTPLKATSAYVIEVIEAR